VERGLVLGKSAEWHKENDAPVTFFSFDALDDFYHEYVGFEGAACTAVLLDELPRHAGDEAAWQRQVAALQADVPPAPPPPPPPKVEPPKPAPAPAPAPPPPPPKPEPEPVVEIKPAAEPEVWSLKAAPAGAGAEGEDDGAAEAE
jgi:outer membrane biosynthesis protein TonB